VIKTPTNESTAYKQSKKLKHGERNRTPQKTNNNKIEDLVEIQDDESPVSDLRRMMIRMFNEFKKTHKKIQ
jgi:hypothetical protein